MAIVYKFIPLCVALLLVASTNNNANKLYADGIKLNNPLLLFNAASLGHSEAANTLFDLALGSKEELYWLNKLAHLGHVPAAIVMGHEAEKESLQKQYFTIAASQGNAEALFELSLLTDDTDKARQLLLYSAEKDYAPAVILYAKYIFEQDDKVASDDLQLWLSKGAKYDASLGVKYAKYLYQNGAKQEAITAFKVAAVKGSFKAKQYLEAVKGYSPVDVSAISNLESNNLGCLQNIQMLSTDLDTTVQAIKLSKQFKNDQRLKSLNICLESPVWLSSGSLECESDEQDIRQYCDLEKVIGQINHEVISNLIVILPRGKAYTQRGVMYLDKLDDYSVFVHELAHFAGFMDEYRLSAELAEYHCTQSVAPNIIFGEIDSSQGVDKLALWQKVQTDISGDAFSLEAESLSISPARTCENTDVVAYKPSAQITFLEHHDTNYIPPLYLELWRQQLISGEYKFNLKLGIGEN
ncbi:hypothetical protein [Glaciecola sp. 1036]|uniref:hypothetical protein n=1 Tax=Alteromonadaceae TaxID=72275 RepID=UPI003D03A660